MCACLTIQVQRCCTSDLCNTPIPPSAHPRNNVPTTPTSSHTPPPSTRPPSVSSVPPTVQPPSLIPPILIPETPGGETSYLCNCDDCRGSSTCRGVRCATRVVYTGALFPDMVLLCVNNTAHCSTSDLTSHPTPGTVDTICCAHDLCNIRPILPTTPHPPSPSNNTGNLGNHT